MTRDPRYPDRVPRRRYASHGPTQTTKALTAKLAALAIVGTLVIGGLIAAQMAAGNDPSLGPKAVAAAKKSSANSSTAGSSTGSSSGSDSGTDPYAQQYGDSSGSSSSGYSSGSSGYSSGSGYSTQQYSPPPVTSSTS
jgi:hypothetical protein